MSSIYKVAGSFNKKLKVYANSQVLATLDNLVSNALALFKARHVWGDAARHQMAGDPEAIYSDYDQQVDKQKVDRALELVDQIYFAAVNLKDEANDHNGMTKEELATRKTRLMDKCDRLKKLAAKKAPDPAAFRLLSGVISAIGGVPEMNIPGNGTAKPASPSFKTPDYPTPARVDGLAFDDDDRSETPWDPAIDAISGGQGR